MILLLRSERVEGPGLVQQEQPSAHGVRHRTGHGAYDVARTTVVRWAGWATYLNTSEKQVM